ncbi:putative pentatricopeptide repeat-containing protein At5g37570 isoform X2 [Carica papaya]|uniref:putative pentatricopeptide repeat-containing protein At5g37570 isoform X2 n=1 Tax=Carica papaya TaxID=3649 RepID=UPI000B8CE6C0|nr:putative pentatricopeptide repeat-containing protein At5g37570 isoform X2 [Carica papaya]
MRYARHMFDKIPNSKNQFLWTSLIRSHVLHGQFSRSILLYARMHRKGVLPSRFTFSSVLNACARLPALLEGFVLDARKVFDMVDEKDIVSWTAMICGYTKMQMMGEARRLFDLMGEHNVVSCTAIVAGYANSGEMEAAKKLYDRMVEKNSITWVAMIAGYGKCGDVGEARRVFDEIREPNSLCWAAMVACYAQNGFAKEAIEMYEAMREEKVRITEVAMVGAISASAQLGDMEIANKLEQHIEEGCCDRTVFVSNVLIHMHAKCGSKEQAWREFNKMKERDVISYSTMMSALADHGESEEVLSLFLKMQKDGIKPNHVTFTTVLNACSRGGLVEEGCKHFKLMVKNFRIEPLREHLTCMVDLLGRAGKLGQAYDLVKEYTVATDAGVWTALLGASKIHGNAELGEIAARHLFKMEPDNAGNLVLMANTYASFDKWDKAETMRTMMSKYGERKSAGCSWISSLTQNEQMMGRSN